MKKIITILAVVLTGYSVFYWVAIDNNAPVDSSDSGQMNNQTEEPVMDTQESIVEPEGVSRKLCFSRDQLATEDAPYSVKEYIEMDINKSVVSGLKKGTQEGPGMTNGYQGALSGEIVDSEIGVVFSYTIEGSDQKEEEEYILESENLIKQRYALVEEGGVLVPDKSSEVKEIIYTKTICE